MNSNQIFNREFLEIRAKILEIAASLDRIERAEGNCDDSRMGLIHEGIELISQDGTDRAEKVQLLFSRDYTDRWRDEFGI